MAASTVGVSSAATLTMTALPQLVPNAVCLSCEVCCRFPDPDSPLRPYFTGEEIERAVKSGGLSDRLFPSLSGHQVALLADPGGEGYLCPAFDAKTGHCRIYDQRPLDCRLYPLVLMWNATHDEVLLGWDSKCPFMLDQIPAAIRTHAEQVTTLLNQPAQVQAVSKHPRLIGRFQDDVVVLAPLPALSQALASRWGAQAIYRLTLTDVPRLQEALRPFAADGMRTLAAYSAVYHYMGNALMTYWWIELEGALCLFIQSPDGWFMPLPPLTGGSPDAPVAAAFDFMRRQNGASPVSRIENVSALLAAQLQPLGYRLMPKEPDYLYRVEELAALAGDRFKSQRALCNRIERMAEVAVTAYGLSDRRDCRSLLLEWQEQKRSASLESLGRLLLEDAPAVHEVIWSHAAELGLVGTVIRIGGRVKGYTFGYWLTPDTWCVLLEIADRSVPGLAQYMFRESCRRASAQGAVFVNTMDDAGLQGLRASKQTYHPVAMVENFVLSEAVG